MDATGSGAGERCQSLSSSSEVSLDSSDSSERLRGRLVARMALGSKKDVGICNLGGGLLDQRCLRQALIGLPSSLAARGGDGVGGVRVIVPTH